MAVKNSRREGVIGRRRQHERNATIRRSHARNPCRNVRQRTVQRAELFQNLQSVQRRSGLALGSACVRFECVPVRAVGVTVSSERRSRPCVSAWGETILVVVRFGA